MKEKKSEKIYKSPQRKLVRFFEKSRNQWKEKCRAAKTRIKRLNNRVRFLEKSKAYWKNRAKKFEKELARVKQKKRKKKESAELKKTDEEPPVSGYPKRSAIVPSRHKYSVGHIMLFISLVLSAGLSFRGAGRAIEIFISSLKIPLSSPSWFSGRLWLLRLGYYKLTRPKEKGDDWAWIVDHTIQIGAEKCFVILGIRLSSLPRPDRCLKHEDVEPIALYPVTKSDGNVVYQQLERTVEKTGLPRAIVGDHGSDLKSGVNRFCRIHQETCYIYDIKHKTAAVLKQGLGKDGNWAEFSKLAARTKKRVQQTQLAYLAPPNQRTKARYMNLDVLVIWGRNMIHFFEKQEPETKREEHQKKIEEKLGWVKGFREQLEEWEELFQVISITESYVRKRGLAHNSYSELKKLLADKAKAERTKKVRNKLLAFVGEESLKAKPGERLLGSSEVLESSFGKLKQMEHDQAKSGFTVLLLSMAAIVAETTTEVIQNAMEKTATKKIFDRCKNTLGKSVQAKRREAFKKPKEAEQKWDQIQDAA